MKLVGYCSEGEHRLLVYEFLEKGSLEQHLFRSKTSVICMLFVYPGPVPGLVACDCILHILSVNKTFLSQKKPRLCLGQPE